MQYRRDYIAGGCYFFTLVTEQRQKILTLPENIQRLRDGFQREKARYPFTLEAIVILPDHLHCLWWLPDGDADYSGRWSRIKRYFSTGCQGIEVNARKSKQVKREKPVWQRRFWEHRIRDEDDWRMHLDYIHYNPVKHGYVNRPEDWIHGSFLHSVSKGWYELGWGYTLPEALKKLERE